MKQFTGTMSHFATKQDYFEAKSKFYEEAYIFLLSQQRNDLHPMSEVRTRVDNKWEDIFRYNTKD